ncbi:GTPase ObgE [Desulfoferrobacter suflitae]|uniref:GTPase ObgE n=1 Tax=Desulfoferrobacter suflitae TaxID=2865782 RepID=UPI0021648AB5|nr:GTPase ObgE [Desulfoferrobacter suflitae]MCK8600723.1 GTPase ObgE [Desulfoferrobacter suflitae]
MRFVDEVRIRLEAGKGGQGCVSFRREKYVPRGGPDGGDGGKGGDIYLEASERKHTLLDFRYRHSFIAPPGKHGQGQNKHGKGGQDLILEVPVGTVVKTVDTGEVIADLSNPGQRWLAAGGGPGGKGNARFVTSAVRVPRFAEDGCEGERKELVLELKLLADVGLVGLPNAGKSTLIAAISAARPKIADYPFTTLVPNLGVVQYADSPPFVVADIPGLIEGAHQGVGLGTRFLRHIERTRVLLHVIDISRIPRAEPLLPFNQIENELACYSQEIVLKRRVIALNKTDLVADAGTIETIASAYRQTKHPVVVISALQREGLQDLQKLLVQILNSVE